MGKEKAAKSTSKTQKNKRKPKVTFEVEREIIEFEPDSESMMERRKHLVAIRKKSKLAKKMTPEVISKLDIEAEEEEADFKKYK